jgi:hypothetical protein
MATRWIITGSHHRATNVPGQVRQVDASKESLVDISSGLSVPALSSVLYRVDL